MRRFLICLSSALLASCSQNSFDFKTEESVYGVKAPRILINGGALYTNNMGVTLTTESPDTVSMKISNDPSCPGEWTDQAQVISFNLKDENLLNSVYGRFRSRNGVETDCVKASILHDNKNPWVDILQRPADPSPTNNSNFKFDGGDTGSGLDYFECQLTSGVYIPCAPQVTFNGVADGANTLVVRTVDKAGNRSDSDNAQWLVDTTPPVVMITKGPASSSNTTTATFEFTATDGSGSGVKHVSCKIGAIVKTPCTSPLFFAGLTPGNHSFMLWSEDNVGHVSPSITYNWTIDNVPSGDFAIAGVEAPPTDVKVDTWLRGTTPTVHWTKSDGATEYKVSILSTNNAVVCGEQTTSLLMYAFSASCQLNDLTVYKANVVAGDGAGNTRTKTFDFTVDRTPPAITIANPILSGDQKQATINFSVTDLAPGVLTAATCYKTHYENGQPKVTQQSCMGLMQLTFTNLIVGDHKFRITATDAAENSYETEITFKTQQVICDPFAGPLSLCKGGLVGEIYYLNANQQNAFKALPQKTVNFFFTDGTKLNAIVNLLSLFGTTRRFNLGFPTSDGNLVKDDQGNTLVEYFAFKLSTVIHLDVDNVNPALRDDSGYYQFATISDDGTLLHVKRSAAGQWETVVNNDGDHPTRMGCADSTVQFDADTRLPAHLDYYQGPRDYIALTLMWRKVNGPIPNEEYCGQNGSETFFGPYPHDNFTNAYGYGQLRERGWKVLTDRNFIAPQ